MILTIRTEAMHESGHSFYLSANSVGLTDSVPTDFIEFPDEVLNTRSSMATVEMTTGDLLDQDVEIIVNAWNRNIIPWWLLLPQGVSGAIKKRAGYQPFREVANFGPIPLGGAVLTSAGRMPFKGIIHVAGISMWWRSSEYSIRKSCRSAMRIVKEHSFKSIAFPLIGAGTGDGSVDQVEKLMTAQLRAEEYDGRVVVVRFKEEARTFI